MFETLKERGFQVETHHHAEAILAHDMVDAVSDIEAVLLDFTISAQELVEGGGGEADLTQRLRRALSERGWAKHVFQVDKSIDGVPRESISHEVDHVKRFPSGVHALEIEWNNKDPFFDRDLENFKRLHADGAISVGAIITRGITLHESMRDTVAAFARAKGLASVGDLDAYYTPTPRQRDIIERSVRSKGSFADGWAAAFVSDKYGESTTHWRKLEDRVSRGVGNPCPLLLIGIPRDVVRI